MSSCCQTVTTTSCCTSQKSDATDWFRLGLAAVVSAQSMIFGLAISLHPPEGQVRTVLHAVLALAAVGVFLLVGVPLLRTAIQELLRGRIVVEQMFLAGIAGAFAVSIYSTVRGEGSVYYEVVSVLLAIYTLGNVLGNRRRSSALAAADRLGREFARCNRIEPDGSSKEVGVQEIRKGDHVRVVPGGGIPIDGIVVRGIAFVREAALTGEPFPVVRREGDTVLAGSHVLDQAMVIEATSDGMHRQLDTLLSAVQAARSKPGSLQRQADRVVAWFLPLVLSVALGTVLFWACRGNWNAAIYNGLAVLVVACPCAMGLATPIGIWSALGALVRRGIVCRSGDLVERLGRVDTVVFDKTGTLSEEEFALVDFVSLEGIDRQALLRLAGDVQAQRNHPVARGFAAWRGEANVENVETISGVGVKARLSQDGRPLTLELGNAHLLTQSDAVSAEALRGQLSAAGGLEIFLRMDGRVVGLAQMRERLRESALSTLARLEQAGIECRVMTGDRAANAAAHSLPNVAAGLTSEGKATLVEELAAAGKKVLFVGDGINDAVAMTHAHASLALDSGAELAAESASGRLHGKDLGAVVDAILLCRRTLRAIHFNLLFAAAYNLVGIVLAASGILHPAVAALLMLASSSTVTWRALSHAERLEEKEPRKVVIRKPSWSVPSWLVFAGFALQAGMVVYLGRIEVPATILFLMGGAVLAVGGAMLFPRLPADGLGRMCLGMAAVGNLAMLCGWFVDAGFAAVVRDGVCLCGCSKSGMGAGLLNGLHWMQVSMIPASVTMLGFVPVGFGRRGGLGRTVHWLLCLLAMLLGMEAGMWGMAQFPVSANPSLHFILTFLAMSGGMLFAMLVCCGTLRMLAKEWV